MRRLALLLFTPCLFGSTCTPPAPNGPTGLAIPCPEGAKVSDAQADVLMKRFAPHVHIHPEDSHLPANVDWYLARVRMRFHHGGCPDHQLLDRGKVNQASLVAQTHRHNKLACIHDDDQLVSSTTSEHFFLEIDQDGTREGIERGSQKDWTVYVARPSSCDPKTVSLQYWFFYPYNQVANTTIAHEADWENVTVFIDPAANNGDGALTQVKLSQHGDSEFLKAGDKKLRLDCVGAECTHPVVFSAKGSHANYAETGTHNNKAVDYTKADPEHLWKTENTLLEIGTKAAPRNNQVFIKYWGRWGELGAARGPADDYATGPTRHFE